MARELIDAESSFDVVGDGTTDCTQNLLDAADRAKKKIVAGDPCTIRLPAGDIAISSGLVLEGTTAGAPCCEGADGGAFDLQCSRLIYKGPATSGPVLTTKAFNRGRLRNLSIVLGAASVGLCASAPTGLQQASTSGANFERLTLLGIAAGKTGITLGTDPALVGNQTFQFSESYWSDILCLGNGGGIAIRSLSPGNCKNHDFQRVSFNNVDVALDMDRGSSAIQVWGMTAGHCGTLIKNSSGELTVSGLRSEGSQRDFRMLTGTFDYGTSVKICGGEVVWGDIPEGAEAVLFQYAGALKLEGMSFKHYKDGVLTPFKMVHSRCVDTTFGSFISEQCTYFGCGTSARPYIPIFDGGGNDLAPVPGSYGGSGHLHSVEVKSWGDRGSGPNGQPMRLTPFDSANIRFPRSTA